MPRINQKARTRRAILDACRELSRSGRTVTMGEVAARALVSEATAYRYFPDLKSLLSNALAEDWPSPEVALADVNGSNDPVERVAFATRYLLEGIAAREGAVRAMIAATISEPSLARDARPGLRFGLIDGALAPFVGDGRKADMEQLEQLRRDLTVIASAEGLFSLTDLYGLTMAKAIDSLVQTATTVTRAAFPSAKTRRRPRVQRVEPSLSAALV